MLKPEFLSVFLFILPLLIIPLLDFSFFGDAAEKYLKFGLTDFSDIVNGIVLQFWLYLPLGLIGAWRWAVWTFKKVCAQFYSPISEFRISQSSAITLSVITPVYNEDPRVFSSALKSWELNKPDEIIAVIDHMDKSCISVFTEFSKDKKWSKLIITSKPGKRPALADGIVASGGNIVALVDSDTIWAPDIKEKLIAPFIKDEKIGGVTTTQHPIETQTIWQKMTDVFWDIRNYYDMPSQTAMGSSLSCLSSRTALYRRDIILPHLEEFLNEIILGRKKESGEDKCLTRLIQRQGWKSYYQSNVTVYSTASRDFVTFWKQRLRWSRNSHNSDLVSLVDGWAWDHPYLAFYMIDRFISTFTLFLGPIFFAFALYHSLWILAVSIALLWIFGRSIKILPHLRRQPKDILLIPVFVAVNYLIAVAKLYALVTIREQKWIRETKNDTMKPSKKTDGYKIAINIVLSGLIIGGLVTLVEFIVR